MDMKENPANDEMDDCSTELSDPTGIDVKPKWRGTTQDKLDMNALGRYQVLRVRILLSH